MTARVAWAAAIVGLGDGLARRRPWRWHRRAERACRGRPRRSGLALERRCLLADLLIAVELGDPDRLLPLGFLDQGFLFEQGRLLADLPVLVELRHLDGLLAGRLAGADLAQLGRVGDRDGPLALGLGDADLALLLLLGHVDLGLLNGDGGGLAADGLDVARSRR